MKRIYKLITLLIAILFSCVCIGCSSKKNIQINFIVDNTVYSTITYNGKDVIKLPENPSKEDFVFDGWYWDKDTWQNPFSVDSLSKESLSPEMSVYAHFVNGTDLIGTDINIKNSDKVNVPGIGDVFYLTIRNFQIVCKLYEFVETNPMSTWSVSTNINGSNPIVSKTISVDLGDSQLYYLFVTDKTGKIETYFLIIHRNYLFNVKFNSNGGSSCESQIIEEGYYVENIPTPSRTGYTFKGWDYNFANKPITSNVYAIASWEAKTYSVTYDPNGGSIASYYQSLKYGQSYSLFTPYRKGYNFVCWKHGSTIIPKSGIWEIANNLELKAEWEIINYSITYNLNNGEPLAPLKSTYTIEDTFTIPNVTRPNYVFDGWLESTFFNNPTLDCTIQKGTTGNLVFYAVFTGNNYQIDYDVNGGDPLQSDTQIVRYGEGYELAVPTRNGYNFAGWYDGDQLVAQNGIWERENTTLTAHWSLEDFTITYLLNEGVNNPSNPLNYTIEDSVTFADPSRQGYSFEGWFNENNIKVERIEVGSTGNIVLSARWTALLNNLNVLSDDPMRGTVSIVSGSGYTGEDITVDAQPCGEFVFDGWFYNDKKISSQSLYTFSMPPCDYSLIARFLTQEEKWNADNAVKPLVSDDGKSVKYGLYPQTNVKDEILVEELDKLSTPESNGWYLYNDEYYAKTIASPFSNQAGKFNDGTEVVSGKTYWFKCEPIVWNVLAEDSGRFYILSSVLLDTQRFNEYFTGTKNGHYCSNYEYSEIRSWLNNEFFNSAFGLGNSNILLTQVDNSASTTNSTTNKYVCNDTEDNVFLPSYQDYLNESYGFSSSTTKTDSRHCKATDWAIARGSYRDQTTGCEGNCFYWSRSPSSTYNYDIWDVDYDGNMTYSLRVDYNGTSVRPALNIVLD